MGALVVVTLALPAAASAQDWRVLARLPEERRAEVLAALRVELAGRATVAEGEAPGDEPTDAAMRAQAGGFTHVAWVVFPGGILAPAEVRVLDVSRASAARAMTPQAWDVVDPRVVAVVAASLLEPGAEVAPIEQAEESASAPAPSEPADSPAAPSSARAPSPPPAAPVLPEPAHAALVEPELGRGQRARTFSLWAGLGIAHRNGSGLRETVSSTVQLALYARLSDWASIGLRLRPGFGYSSIEGALVTGSVGLPSFAVSFREPLGTVAAIELGVHAEGNLALEWRENPTWRENRLSFGLGVGAFAVLELGRANAIALDYTVEVYGLGGVEAWVWGSATLSYVGRWD